MTLILGHLGSMGKRYGAILNHLKEPWDGWDPLSNKPPKLPQDYDRFIIASPTNTHMAWLRELECHGKPVLCEKPISKDLKEVEEILRFRCPLTLQMQYSWLVNRHSSGRSYYDFYHHGSDGLIWDCFQIIALATGKVELAETSPIWRCVINGSHLQRNDMDWAYVQHVKTWLSGAELHTPQQILKWHSKVWEFAESGGRQ